MLSVNGKFIGLCWRETARSNVITKESEVRRRQESEGESRLSSGNILTTEF